MSNPNSHSYRGHKMTWGNRLLVSPSAYCIRVLQVQGQRSADGCLIKSKTEKHPETSLSTVYTSIGFAKCNSSW